MKESRFTEAQIVSILKQADARVPVKDINPQTTSQRELSKDPIQFTGGDTNHYGYSLSDQVNLVDSEGASALSPTARRCRSRRVAPPSSGQPQVR
jgi:hypothetical protein